jgi:hypothetical protein
MAKRKIFYNMAWREEEKEVKIKRKEKNIGDKIRTHYAM